MLSVVLFAVLPTILWAAKEFAWNQALPGYHYQFPRDHFEHEDFRTEWWYYTGNVVDEGGKRFGFELVFFRQGVAPGEDNKSVWTLKNAYLGHAALTDASGKRFLYEEKLNRSGPGIAGASFQERKVWNANWSATWTQGDRQTLRAITPKFRLQLELEPEKGFVIQGENGVSQKADGVGMASHYVSFPRLRVKGSIDSHQVTGTAWMDHEWFSNQLAADQLGWDWFSIQLENGTELMLYRFRKSGGGLDTHSSGIFVDKDGKARHLTYKEFALVPGAARHGKYPVEWQVQVPSLGIDLACRPVLANQELAPKNGSVGYWEGAVDFSGSQKGVGYLEMTGYDGKSPLR